MGHVRGQGVGRVRSAGGDCPRTLRHQPVHADLSVDGPRAVTGWERLWLVAALFVELLIVGAAWAVVIVALGWLAGWWS